MDDSVRFVIFKFVLVHGVHFFIVRMVIVQGVDLFFNFDIV